MVPAQGFGLHEDHRKDGEDHQGYHLLNHLQFPEREGPSVLGATQTVSRHLEAVLEEGDTPAQEHDGRQAELFDLRLKDDVSVPGQGHKGVGADQQQDG